MRGIEEMMRNKYCGKGGLFYSMEGGSCAENVVTAVYCSADKRFSSTSGCEGAK